MEKSWSITDTMKGARTIDEIHTLCDHPSKKNFGCVQKPIFPIPVDHVIIDTLHLFLRIGDLLTNLLIMDLRRQDGIDKKRSFKLDRTKQTHIAAYKSFLNEDCKIIFKRYADEQCLKWRDLTGPEKHRLFRRINISNLFPSLPKCIDIQSLWSCFYDLVIMLKSDDIESNDFKEQAQRWVRNFCSVYQTKHVTPYVHALAMHVHEFIELHGNAVLIIS